MAARARFLLAAAGELLPGQNNTPARGAGIRVNKAG